MSCGCENKKMSAELDRARRLAKAHARLDGRTVALLRKEDGTYYSCVSEQLNDTIRKQIVEYFTPY